MEKIPQPAKPLPGWGGPEGRARGCRATWAAVLWCLWPGAPPSPEQGCRSPALISWAGRPGEGTGFGPHSLGARVSVMRAPLFPRGCLPESPHPWKNLWWDSAAPPLGPPLPQGHPPQGHSLPPGVTPLPRSHLSGLQGEAAGPASPCLGPGGSLVNLGTRGHSEKEDRPCPTCGERGPRCVPRARGGTV